LCSSCTWLLLAGVLS